MSNILAMTSNPGSAFFIFFLMLREEDMISKDDLLLWLLPDVDGVMNAIPMDGVVEMPNCEKN